MRKICKKGVEVFKSKRCDTRRPGKFLPKLFLWVQRLLQALIDIYARVPLLEGCVVVVLCHSLQSPGLREAQILEEN